MKYLLGRILGVLEKKKEYGRQNGNIDAITECTLDQRSVGKDRTGNTAYTSVTA